MLQQVNKRLWQSKKSVCSGINDKGGGSRVTLETSLLRATERVLSFIIFRSTTNIVITD